MITRKETTLVFIFLVMAVAIFIPEITFFKKGLLGGDYGQQFYPYSVWYGSHIKNFSSPFYTGLIGCGYSLLSEGQSGFFYPINAFLFFFLPVKVAYQVNPLIHFIFGGLFSYLFIRNKGISALGGLIFSLIFMFGANVCGIGYNTVVQKVLTWFPLGLYCLDRFFSSRRYRFLTGLAMIFMMQIFAGFLQIALYCISFTILYFLIRLFSDKNCDKIKNLFIFSAIMVAVFVLSIPQLLPTIRAVVLSTRADQDTGFSLWGSATPLAPLGLVFPGWQHFVGGNMYGSMALIPLMLLFFKYFKSSPRDIRIFFVLFIISFILALGKYTPILPVLIETLHLSFLRKPSKFLFLSNFFLATCCVWSLDNFIKRNFDNTDTRFISRGVTTIVIISLLGFAAANLVINNFGDQIIAWGDNYVRDFVFGKSFHRYTLDNYYEKVRSFFSGLKSIISLSNTYNWSAILLLLVALFVFRAKRHFKGILFGFIFLDLLVFSQYSTGLKGNFIDWKSFTKIPGYVQFLKSDKDEYRIYNFITKETAHLLYNNYHLLENENMIYGISSIGVYAPIVDREYYKSIKDLGAVDDSLGRDYIDKESLRKNLGFLASLNVKYILSFDDLSNMDGLGEVYREGPLKIYRLAKYLPRIFFANCAKVVGSREELIKYLKRENYDPRECLLTDDTSYLSDSISLPKNYLINIVCKDDEKLTLDIETDRISLIVISMRFTNWKARLDNKKVDIHPLNFVLPGIIIPKGKHQLELRHRPYS